MATEGVQLKATARVKLSKFDEHGNLVGAEEHEIELTKEEADSIWHLQMQG